MVRDYYINAQIRKSAAALPQPFFVSLPQEK